MIVCSTRIKLQRYLIMQMKIVKYEYQNKQAFM